jgi:hypothetical protein
MVACTKHLLIFLSLSFFLQFIKTQLPTDSSMWGRGRVPCERVEWRWIQMVMWMQRDGEELRVLEAGGPMASWAGSTSAVAATEFCC